MKTYKTFSRTSELTGSMDVSNGVVISYVSDALKGGDIDSRHNSVLDFKVSFPTVSRKYHIKSIEIPGGIAYVGAAKNDKGILAEEPWAATASTMVLFEEEETAGDTSEADEYTATRSAG